MDAKRRTEFYSSKDIAGIDGREIEGKKIVLCITGSVAAYRSIDLARQLIRHGAEVYPVMSEAVGLTLLTPEMMKWATGNNVVTKITGSLEHIALADYNMSDLIVVYPCTANTIGKVANGINDTPVTSVLSVGLGSRIPIIIAPAMHEAMYGNRLIQENIQRVKDQGVDFLQPIITEGKAKVVSPEQMLQSVITKFTNSTGSFFFEKNILVTAGSTIEYIDPIRVITNLSSGKMGNIIAEEAIRMGANITLVYGHGTYSAKSLPNLNILRVNTSKEMYDVVMSELSSKRYDVAILSAAVADYTPERKAIKKIRTSRGKLLLPLLPTQKIINRVKHISKQTFLVGFKAEYNVSDSNIIKGAYRKLKECKADLIVANDVGRKNSVIGSENNEVFVIDKHRNILHLPPQNKNSIARKLLNVIENLITHNKM
ncbi:MAG TPA: bifunctional phosphopantothenoylcysteine decarboxylase/phosphopantothenate--cysteine ligase CoaBC [Nitrososphaeraceae archaeon]|nr:bifunctional phosphopantothenoylcysteine decarboxylase/phosphopantothenate--cysteine ligase CoaBC [Nitrososphaeraceae archaeon]